ncbi:AMP-binding protein [Pseudotabrizicola sp. L79]|uniref:AMP-binding protein n=1 Tax=Pseudotabrizicola sp. L79 TaxID=3118402 RepID=UPI002F954D06
MTIYHSPNGPVAVPDLSISDLVLRGLDRIGPNRALACEATGEALTGAVLAGRIRRFAGGLVERHGQMRPVVANMAPNTPDFATVFHGTALAGGTVTTVNPTYTVPELHHQLQDSGAQLLVVPPALLAVAQAAARGTGVAQIATLAGMAEGVPGLDDLMGAPLMAQVPVDLARHIVALPYSSGTTGLPKGVMLSHRNLVANVVQIQSVIQLAPREATLAILPFFHIYGMQVMMNLYLAYGAGLISLPRFDLETALRVLSREQVQKFFVAPPVVLALAKHPLVDQFDLSALSFLLSGAAPLGGDVAQAAGQRLGAEMTQGYGMTEASPVTHFTAPGQNRIGTVGPLVPGTEARIVDAATGADAAEGELWVRGPQVMLGYWNNPEATARSLDAEGWLRTGDLARVHDDGTFEILDRVKELIKVSGFQVAPAEVEAALLTHPRVADAAVTAIADDQSGERPCAHIVIRPGEVLTEDDLHDHLATCLAPYKRPTKVVFVDAIPKSASGKILRRLLRA